MSSAIPLHVHMQPVESTTIAAVGADRSAGLLYVIFRSGHAWAYGDIQKPITEAAYAGLLAAKSRGRYFLEEIKPYYPGHPVGTSEIKPSVPKPEPEPEPGSVIVASPVYLALLQLRKRLKSNPNHFLYKLFVVCGRTSGSGSRYSQALDVLASAGGIGPESLEAAIIRAKELKI